MKTYNYKSLSGAQIQKLCKRDYLMAQNIKNTVREIGAAVETKGDTAVIALTAKIDGVKLKTLKVSAAEFNAADKKVNAALKAAIKTAKQNIVKFHKEQLPAAKRGAVIETTPGVFCSRKFSPIDTAGLYVPGGSAPLFSTVLMLALPAKIAGCKNIVLCTPPAKDGSVAPEILYTAKLCGVTNVFKAGGAQAVFAMAYGTKSIPKADKIFGPGNQYVTEAKMQVSNICAIDMPAGPSEVLVIADKNTNPAYAAADILSQAEHGADSQAVLVSTSPQKTQEILAQVTCQLKNLPRKEAAQKALNKSFAVNAPDMKTAVEFSNIYAPEHLILNFKDWQKYINLVTNAGSVFCGELATESFGDYASGTNHTLPTSGFAKSFSGVNTQSFGKWITMQWVNKKGLKNLGKKVALMARAEGLAAHANAVEERLK